MIGVGKKDEDGKQVRLEHRGKYTRASRTAGVAVRAEKKIGSVNFTANSSRGIRVSKRIANGTRVALQNGRFQLIGRWRSGPLGFNLSKSGVSASVKNKAGTYNFLKPQYSSFKFAGIQLRGKKAAQMQSIYILIVTAIFLLVATAKVLIFLLKLVALSVLFVRDFSVGFVRGVREDEDSE